MAKNDKIMEDLEKNIRIVVKGIDFDIKDHFRPDEVDGFKHLWEMLRDVLDTYIVDEDGNECYLLMIPEDVKEYRHFLEVMEQYMVEIDCVIDRDLPDIQDKKDLAFNLKQFCKDYMYAILNIMESNPNISREQFEEEIIEWDGQLKNALMRRAGYDDSLDDVVLYALAPEEKQKMDIENIPAEKKPSKQGEPDIPLGKRKFR